MRRLNVVVAGVVIALVPAACGLEMGGIPGDGGALLPEGGDEVIAEGGASDTGQPLDVMVTPDVIDEPGPPQPCTTPPGACVASVPGGWTLVAYENARATGCPGNYTQKDLLTSPQAQAGACDCGCNIGTNPVCDVGSIAFKVTGAMCSSVGVTANVNGPGCQNLGAATVADHVQGNPIAPSGGMCTAPTLTNSNKVVSGLVRACEAPTECREDVCNGKAPLGFSACIASPGTQTCPLGWSANPPVFVGTGVDLTCSTCTCQVNQPSTCTNATMQVWNNGGCTGNPGSTIVVDGTCKVPSTTGNNVDHFKYAATLNPVCQSAGPKSPITLDVSGKTTLCCK